MPVPRRRFEYFEFLSRDRRLSVEFLHILTDGGAAFEFLTTLVLTYFEACGTSPRHEEPWLNPNEPPWEEEFEDGFSKYFQQHIPFPKKKPRSFHLPFALNAPPRLNVLDIV